MVSGLTEIGPRRVAARCRTGRRRTFLRMIAAGEGELPLDEIWPAPEESFAVVADQTLGRVVGFRYGISPPTEHTAEVRPAGTRWRLAGIKAEWDPASLFRSGPAVPA